MPVQIPATKKTPARVAEHDEFIRDDTTAEQLAALPVQPGTKQMTAANSTPLSDGASAIVLASGERAAELGVEPLARVVSSAVYALDPLIMGLAPAWALPLAIKRAGLSPEQIDVWEVHEAFSAQALGVFVNSQISWAASLFRMRSSRPTAVRWPSAIRSARPVPATS